MTFSVLWLEEGKMNILQRNAQKHSLAEVPRSKAARRVLELDSIQGVASRPLFSETGKVHQ